LERGFSAFRLVARLDSDSGNHLNGCRATPCPLPDAILGARQGHGEETLADRSGRALAEKVGVGGHRASERADVDDAVDNVDDLGDGSNYARADDDVGAGHKALGVQGVIEESPRQTGVVHRVEVDDQVEFDLRARHGCSLSVRLNLMIRILPQLETQSD
jgi:hypothetical protein